MQINNKRAASENTHIDVWQPSEYTVAIAVAVVML